VYPMAHRRPSRLMLGTLALAGLLLACTAPTSVPTPPKGAGPAEASAAAPGAAAAGAPAAGLLPTAAPASRAEVAPPREPWTYAHVSLTATFWPHFVGMQLGYFDQEGLELERLVSPSSAQLTAGIASGSINSGAGLPDAYVRAVEQGAPVVIIASEMSTVIYSLMVPPSIQDFADLRGKAVGTSEPRGATTLILRKMFGLGGLGEQDYDLLVVGGTRERYTALKAGTISAALLSQPQDFQLADEGFRRLALSTASLKPYLVGALAANPDWMRQNEARTVRYLRALIRSARWLTDPANKEAAIRILMDETKAEERYARLTYELYLEEEQVVPPEAEVDPRSLDTVLDLMVEGNDLSSPRPPASKYLDTSYWERARGTAGATGR